VPWQRRPERSLRNRLPNDGKRQRRDRNGDIIPRKIINAFTCEFNGRPVFRYDLDTAVAENPYLAFAARVEESGTFRFAWRDNDGNTNIADENIVVIR